jgi:hypothetical protein
MCQLLKKLASASICSLEAADFSEQWYFFAKLHGITTQNFAVLVLTWL